MLQAIVFDFDGVIVDSEPLHYQAFVMVGKSIGFAFSYEEYLATYIGFDDRDAFRVMLEASGEKPTTQRIEALCAMKQPAFETLVKAGAASGSMAIPGALELIDECHAAAMPIAIASGATRADIELMLELLGRRDRFEVIVTADDVELSKPDPTSYALAVQRLGLTPGNKPTPGNKLAAGSKPTPGSKLPPGNLPVPGNTLAIEDTAAGLASARGAGLMTLGLATTGPAEALAEADRVIDNLAGVTLAQLKKWF